MIATTTQLLSSGEFCKLRYDTTPVKSASANVSFHTNNSKIPNFELTLFSQMSDITATDELCFIYNSSVFFILVQNVPLYLKYNIKMK
jgi:hypothetical protein